VIEKAKTVSILQTLAVLPSGRFGPPLKEEELTRYLQVNYKTDDESARNNRHALRDELYRDGGVEHMNKVIDSLFTDPDVRRLRKAVVPFARFNNAIKRIVNEMSTVYSEPARRLVADDAPEVTEGQAPPPQLTPNNDKYQALLEEVCMDERMVEIGRLLNLHRALLVGFRVRKTSPDPTGPREPVLDIATPSNVRAVTHPNDGSLVIGWMVRTSFKSAVTDGDAPKWTLWTDHESVHLREDLSVIGSSYQEHGLGVCPWVPVTLGPPSSGFWPGSEGEDLVSGHITIWFENVLLIKESKSATKQTVIQGDGTGTGRGQAADSEVPNELADGQSATTVDMSMDLDLFTGTADHVLSHLAQNYGMSPALITHQGVQSAEARELMRMPLKEIRRQQQVPLRRFEHRLVIVMARVLEADYTDLAFDPRGWRIEYAESETPLDPVKEHELFEKRRGAGLDNTAAFLCRKLPGLTPDGALGIIETNVLVETERNRLMRPLMAISGSLGANTPMIKGAQDQTNPPKPGSGEDSTKPDDESDS
jgi:hypothetical protein